MIALFALAVTIGTPTGETCWFRDAASTSSGSVYLLCEDGRLVKSADGGKHWKENRIKGAERLYSVAFADDRRGFVSGIDGSLFRTEDGGVNWTKIATNTGSHLNDIAVQGDRVWAVGSLGTILSSSDGGTTWQKQESRAYGTLENVFFLDQDHGWTVGSFGTLLRTVDGGKTWEDIDIPNVFERLNSVFFVTPERGWITSMGGPLLRTEDGGATWKKLADPGRGWYQGVVFDAKGRGYLASESVMVSDDWGTSWKMPEHEVSAWRVLMNNGTLWAVGPFDVHSTTDGVKFADRSPFGPSEQIPQAPPIRTGVGGN